ncbi:potassium channel subfamily K member 1 [Caerostris extrusa]|uniref:Potassium channel subfamily K member 1 n=1 Tax=Caerostris extrusa TaxID=172846 RepID=A0AAV4NI81_CAEEX|nr:potassium channel subfamily K member 1 [Caerostris extrusa]
MVGQGLPESALRQKTLNSASTQWSHLNLGLPLRKAIDELFEQLSAVGIRGLIFGNGSVKWTYGNSVLFSMTLLTTIGYGHLSPITVFGKIMCMIYTAVGIPITLIILALYVDRLTSLSNIYKANLFRRLGYQNPLCVRLLHFSTVMIFIMVGNFFLPAWVFYCLEISWSYLDSIYFCFISLTTVGLGDFVPGIAVHHPHVELYRFGATIYLLIGVTVVMFMMGLATDFWQNYNKGYHIIPMKVIPEKLPIKLDVPPSYGSIVVHTTETLDETKILIP